MEVIKANVTNEVFNFWNAVKIYYDHPNSINKQVIFSEGIFSVKLKYLTPIDCRNLYQELVSTLEEYGDLSGCLTDSKYSEYNFEIVNSDNAFVNVDNMCLLVRRLIPKYVDDNTEFYEFLFCDKISSKVYFFTKFITSQSNGDSDSVQLKKQDPFVVLKFTFIQLIYSNNSLELFYDKSLGEKGINWLKSIFITKFMKLVLHTNSSRVSNKLSYESKVDVVQYYKFYDKMKSKYAKYLIENWMENTDPKKFVYEDIGIATYLMMLWNGGNIPDGETKKQKFVDLGCGNGLLVHILNSEGHLGVGLDIRRRKIWDAYPVTTVLKEETIVPTVNSAYLEADWLIGNHSDELTAWIPIMARKSNRHCQYFVLPCCPYHLNGKKFQRKNSGLSCYQDFIGYVKEISELCDFDTYVDKLRIPSTKRICLIGHNKPENSDKKFGSVNIIIDKFIQSECQLIEDNMDDECNNSGRSNANKTTLDFKVREPVEKVRNCTKLSQGLVDKILKIVMNQLLKETVTCSAINDEQTYNWNRGGKLPISVLAASVDGELLRQLKNECKGLQTLLKNHHFLFEIAQGSVQLRSPESMEKICSKLLEGHHRVKWKRKSCWFFNNHPDKCPLPDDRCSYSHDK